MDQEMQNKFMKIFEYLGHLVGDHYAQRIIDNVNEDRNDLVRFIKRCDHQGIEPRDQAKILISHQIRPQVIIKIPMDGIFENADDIEQEAMHLVSHVMEIFDNPPYSVEVDSIFPYADIRITNIHGQEEHDENCDGDCDSNNHENEEDDKDNWIDKWTKMYEEGEDAQPV